MLKWTRSAYFSQVIRSDFLKWVIRRDTIHLDQDDRNLKEKYYDQ